jgi:hypothetical protein
MRLVEHPIDLVTGGTKGRMNGYCYIERRPRGIFYKRDRCGPDARYFEPRASDREAAA